MIHELKVYPEYFEAIWDGYKNFEVREEREDRKFKVGDCLILREWNSFTKEYTGRSCFKNVIYILRNFKGLQPSWVILGLEII